MTIAVNKDFKAYQGKNQENLVFALIDMFRGRMHETTPVFMTYKQAQELGGQVRKGEKGHLIGYYGIAEKTDKQGNVYTDKHRKSYRVFNVSQIDGLPEQFYFKIDLTVDNADAA